MTTLQIRFTKIVILEDGDPWGSGEGEIYYELRVNDVVIKRDRNNPIMVDDGDRRTTTIDLIKEHPYPTDGMLGTRGHIGGIELNVTDSSQVTISGWVADVDDLSDDKTSPFSRTYNKNNAFGVAAMGEPVTDKAEISGDGVRAIVYWQMSKPDSIVVVSQPDALHQPGTAILYDAADYNANVASRWRVFFVSQKFTEGAYNLPYPPEDHSEGQWVWFPRLKRVGAESVSSARVGWQTELHLFDELDQKGNSIVLTADTSNMPDGWDNRAKSIQIVSKRLIIR